MQNLRKISENIVADVKHFAYSIKRKRQRLCSRLTALWRYINFVLLLLLL